MKEIFTIGHSNISFDDFISLLKQNEIKAVADVRGFPGSKKFPWFNKENLQETLPAENIQYLHIEKLGGRRKVKPDSKNTGWRNPQFRGYADYMETEDFKEGIKILTDLADKKKTTYMCSEVLYWRCHRSMISDYLKLHGWHVIHIAGTGKNQEHKYTSPARIIDGKLDYSLPDQ